MGTKAVTKNPAREPMRLGFGSCAPARNVFARWCFFQALTRRVPKAIRDLVTISQRPTLQSFDAGCFDNDTEAALRAWADKWGLPYGDYWWMAPTRSTVKHWRAFPDEAGRWPGVIGAYKAIAWPTIHWPATEESERDFDARVKQYKAAVKAMPGVTPTPETFTEQHFEAFVMEHVAGLLPERIPFADVSSIRKRNQQLADLLGLRLRRRKPGRPRKARKTGTPHQPPVPR